MSKRPLVNWKQIVIGTGALLIGLAQYVLFRPADSTYLGKMIGAFVGDFSFNTNIFGVFGGILPEFVHPFSFSLITIAIFPQASQKLKGWICVSWLSIEMFFEVGQSFGETIARRILTVFHHETISEHIADYFVNGTYDHMDVVALCLGTITAYIVSKMTVGVSPVARKEV